MSYKEKLDTFIWSYSRVHCYETCPYSFYKKYIEESVGISNFYAENGKAMHLTFERLLKKEITLDEAPAFYTSEFDNICEIVKQDTMDKTFEKCIEYLCKIDPLDETRYEVVGVEEKFNFEIKGYKFVGYADCILKDKTTNEVLIVDHKSSDYLLKKNGEPLKNMANTYTSYVNQLYTYGYGFYKKYGYYPNKIVVHHFKDSGKTMTIDFDLDKCNEVLGHIVSVIKKIYDDTDFLENQSFMNCYTLCGYRDDCEYKIFKEEGENL